MNNSQVAHLWANRSRSSAKGSNFYFDNETVYSYGSHFAVARHYKGVVLFTSKGYSVTTTQHKNLVHRACSHLTVYTVADVMRDPCGQSVKDYAAQIKDLSTKLSRARNPQWLLCSLQTLVSEANGFCERFGFSTRFSMPDEATLAVIRERAKVETARKARLTAARSARLAREHAELVARWIAGENNVSIPYNVPLIYLRTVGDEMHTSRGARVPLADAERAFRFVMRQRSTGWHRNGEQFAIGEFRLDSVNQFGVVAGCHRVTWSEIERYARTQGWL